MPNLFDTINKNINTSINKITKDIHTGVNKAKKEKLTSTYLGTNLILSLDYYDHSKPVKLSGLEYGFNSKGAFVVRGNAPKVTPQLIDKIQKQFGLYAYIDGNYIINKKSNKVVGLVNAKGDTAFTHKIQKRTLSEAHGESFDRQSHETHTMKVREADKKARATTPTAGTLATLAFTPLSMISVPNIVAGVSEASKGNYANAFSKWTGTSELTGVQNKGIFEVSKDMSKWYDEHPATGTLANIGGDVLSVVGAGKALKNIKEVPAMIDAVKSAPGAAKEAILAKGMARAQAVKGESEAAKAIYDTLSKRAKKALETLDKLAQKQTLIDKLRQAAEKANEVIKEEIKNMSSSKKRLLAKEYIKGGKEELAHKTTTLAMDMWLNPWLYIKTGLKKTGKFGFNVGKDMAIYTLVASPAADWSLKQFNVNPNDRVILKEAVSWPTTSLVSRGLDRLTILGLLKGHNALNWFGNKIYTKASEGLIRNAKLDKLGNTVGDIQNKIDNILQWYSKNTHPLLFTDTKKDIAGNLSTVPKEALMGMGFGTLEETHPELNKFAWVAMPLAHNITHRLENGIKYNLHLNSGGAQTADKLLENFMKPTTAYNGMLSVVGKFRRGEGKRAADSDILTKFGGMADVSYGGKTEIPGLYHYTTLSVGNKYSNPYLKAINEAKYIADKLYQPYKRSAWERFRRSKGDAVDIFSPYSLKEFNYLLDNAKVLPSQYAASYLTKLPSASSFKGEYTTDTKKINEQLNSGLITKEQAETAINALESSIVLKFKSYNFGKEYKSKINEIFSKDAPFKTLLSEATEVLKKESAALKTKLIKENRFFGQHNKEFAKTMEEYKLAIADGDKKKANEKLEQFISSISNGKALMSLRLYLLSGEYTNIANHASKQGDLIIGKNMNHIGGKTLGNLVYNWKGNRWAPASFLIKDKNGIYREFGLGSDFGGTGSGGGSEPGGSIFEKLKRASIKNSKYHLDVGSKSLPVVFSPIDMTRTASGRTTTNMVPVFYHNKKLPIFNLPMQLQKSFFRNFIFNY